MIKFYNRYGRYADGLTVGKYYEAKGSAYMWQGVMYIDIIDDDGDIASHPFDKVEFMAGTYEREVL